MNHTDAGAAFTELLLEAFRFNGALLAAGDQLTSDVGLTSARWQVMGMLDGRAAPVPNIAREMGLTRQGVQRTVNILEKEGLVELRENPHHKRAKLVALSPEGRRRLTLVANDQAQWANTMTDDADAAQLRAALNVIRTLRIKIEKETA
ncbi:MAG: MarR family transcriptional regulator [Rhodospirillaceae bacterium]|nr:MarR family transcriptional regulator [Rhodospirillaceae bacterium]